MKVEFNTQWVANTIVFEDSDDIYLRLVSNNGGLAPIWYELDEGNFRWVEDSHEFDIAFTNR